MSEFMNQLLDEVGDARSHPLTGLLDVVAGFVHDYEQEYVKDPKPPPAEVLRFLMEQQGVGLMDLAAFFDCPDTVAKAASGLCAIAPRQARALGKRFRVPPSMFL
jgi:antitoxin component HigA of HigAB toxin-antitoxin module